MRPEPEQRTLTGDRAESICNPAYLAELYHEHGKTLKEIATQLGVAKSTITRRFQKYDIDRREWGGRGYDHVVPYRTDHEGYERWRHQYRDESGAKKEDVIAIHRLCAVAWFGFDSVADDVVHHESNIPWDNRESNLTIMNHTRHSKLHNPPKE